MAIRGTKQTEEHIRKRMESRKANGWHKDKEAFSTTCSNAFKGRSHSEETKLKMSEAKKRFHPMQGKKHTAETRLKISLAQKGKARPKQSGANSSFWKGGTTSKMKIARQSVEYRNWRDALFARDDYTCQACGARGGELSPDHVMPMSLYPEMQFDVLNGRTLCRECHKNTETFGCKIRQFEPEMKFLLALTNPAIV